MSTTTVQFDGAPLYLLRYGPLELVSTMAITPERIDAAGENDPVWDTLGLRIDPRRHGHDALCIAREIRLYMDLEALATGVSWDLDADLIAARIHLDCEPVVIPLWREL